jgi:hypothetical protein
VLTGGSTLYTFTVTGIRVPLQAQPKEQRLRHYFDEKSVSYLPAGEFYSRIEMPGMGAAGGLWRIVA